MDDAWPDIALFGAFPPAGGICRHLMNMIDVWCAAGLRVDLVAFRDGVRFYPDEMPEAVRFFHLGTSGKYPTAYALWRYLRRRKPSVIMSTTHLSNVVLAVCGFFPGIATRRYLSVPNTIGKAGRKTSGRKIRRKSRQVRWLYPHSDGVITVSRGVGQDLQETIGLRGVTIRPIYNATITPRLAELAREPTGHQWLEEGDRPVLLGAGRLNRQKDFSTLVRAFARVRETIPARLVIIGEGSERPRIESLIQELGVEGDVSLPGFVDNPYCWMAAADVFVLSSRWEGLGNVVAEALGVGTPVVSTDCPSGPREILDDGRYGYLVPVGDDGAIAEAVLSILHGHHPRYDPEVAVSRFRADVVAKAHLEFFGLPGASEPSG